jgi:hypothetical protein
MTAIKYRELKRRYELDGPQRTTAHLCEALREKKLRPEDFSFRDLAEALVPDGHQWVRQLDPRNSSSGVNLLEAGDGVDVTAFLNVTGQVIYSKIMEGYQQEEFIIWQPQSWSDVPPRARPIEAAVDGCFNAAQAAAFMEGFNTRGDQCHGAVPGRLGTDRLDLGQPTAALRRGSGLSGRRLNT